MSPQSFLASFDQKLSLKYSVFCPRLFNWCLSLGFDKSKLLPSVAFCSDESQGYPTMIIAKHFGWSVLVPLCSLHMPFHRLTRSNLTAGILSSTAKLAPLSP
jgi:hypothetical protein